MSSVSWNLHPFKADFILGNSQKSLGVKSEEQTGYTISVIYFAARNYLTKKRCELEHCHWWPKFRLFLCMLSVHLSKVSCTDISLILYISIWMHHIPHFFNIFIRSVRFWRTTSFMIFHILVALFEPFLHLKKCLTISKLLPHKPRTVLHKCHLHSSLISHKIYCSFVCLKLVTHFCN
jgi:hypothetical protein